MKKGISLVFPAAAFLLAPILPCQAAAQGLFGPQTGATGQGTAIRQPAAKPRITPPDVTIDIPLAK
ncbi:MAG TPA: hypothetical protein PKM41_13850 [Deltaproteobacteria bacterium]|jgi:hypothetical protein|nr:hypothetical protein [Deltaproteobacteria bacterium]HOI08563.1 hypothetical protein [Deltaproteobacteria bacterium]